MYPKLTYFVGGFVAALGVAVTVTDPATLDNIMTFPERLHSYFEDEETRLIDSTTTRILVEGHVRQALEAAVEIPSKSKDELAAHWANECLQEAGKQNMPPSSAEISLESDQSDSVSAFDEFALFQLDGTANSSRFPTIILPDIISYCAYRTGLTLGILGSSRLAQHIENPGKIPLKNPLGKLDFGEMLLELPSVTQAIQSD